MTTQTMEKPATHSEVTRTEPTRCGLCYRPNVDIVEQANELTVLADMPGVSARQIDIKFENGTLEIFGKVEPRQTEETRFLLQEYGVGHFHRTFQVSEAIDAAKISAEYADGVLTLHLPKVEAARPRRIEVTTK